MISTNKSLTLFSFFSLLLLLGLIFSPIVVTFGQESEIWVKTFGGTNNEDFSKVLLASDGGYVLAGDTASFGAGEKDVWLIKTDSNGNIQWNKTYGGAANDDVQFIISENDAYVIVGRTYSFGEGDADLWLIKTDLNGNMIWNQTYGGPGTEWAFSIVKTSDDGYVLLGRTNSFGQGDNDFWLVKTDSNGVLEWNRTIGDSGDDRGRFLVNTSDGGFLLLGWTNSYGSGEVDYWAIKTDSLGNPQWNKTYGGELADRGITIAKAYNDEYILAGSSSSFGAGNSDIWLVKIDSIGNQIWNKTYGEIEGESVRSIVMTEDGGYAFVGYTSSFGAGDQDGWFVKINSTGTILWNQTYGEEANEILHSFQKIEQGGYLLSGSSASYGIGDTDFWLMKTDSKGIIPEFQSWIIIPFMLSTTFVILISKIKLKR